MVAVPVRNARSSLLQSTMLPLAYSQITIGQEVEKFKGRVNAPILKPKKLDRQIYIC